MKGYVVRVATIPDCQICAENERTRLAKYDAKTKIGPWAYVCEDCFNRWCYGIGVGYGQILIAEETLVDGETKPLT